MAGFEPTDTGVKVLCLTAWRHPIIYGVDDGTRTHNSRNHNPVLCQLNYVHHMVWLKGFEPPAYCLEGSCSIQLS